MMGFEVWDIVRVPFPHTSRPIQQRRPALVVACPTTTGAPPLLWVLMITSAAHRRWPGDAPISTLAETGLPARSIVRSAKIATIEAKDADTVGRLPAIDRPSVAAFLADMLGSLSAA